MAALSAGFLPLAVLAEQDATLELENAWVRALPPFQPNTAAYLTLVNSGEVAVAIVGASSDLADAVELHTTREIDGLMRMEQLQGLAVAPGEQVELAPGGTHLMLLGLEYMPVPGDEVRLCLQLASGNEVCTEAEVRKSADEPAAQNHQHH
jgi:copper(I)-binding protein